MEKRYAPQGLEILGVDEDSPAPKEKIRTVSRMNKLNYPVLLGGDRVAEAYHCCSFLPLTYYVGRKGKIVAMTSGLGAGDAMEADIKKILTTSRR